MKSIDTSSLLIVNKYKFPRGDAGSIREETFARLFREIGLKSIVVGYGVSTGFEKRKLDGIDYYSLRSKDNTVISKVIDSILFFFRLRTIIQSIDCIDYIFLNDIGIISTMMLKRYCTKNRIELMHDSVEWYSSEEFRFGRWSYGYLSKSILNRYLIDRQFKVIAISSFLEDHFRRKGIITLRIPSIFDPNDYDYEHVSDPSKTVFTYAGSPGKKDNIKDILDGFAVLDRYELNDIEIRLIGLSELQLREECGVDQKVIDYLSDQLKCMGRVDHEKVLLQLKESDYTILLRDSSQRYARAGFPTKFAESMIMSTPVICNISSDIDRYIDDGCNGFICSGLADSEVAVSIRRAIMVSYEERLKMQNNAKKTAEKYFSYKNYIDEMRNLLDRSDHEADL